MSKHIGELGYTQDGDQIKVDIPIHFLPKLNEWVGRIQRETDLPIELKDVAPAFAVTLFKLSERTKGRKKMKFEMDRIFPKVKADSIRIFEIRRREDPDRDQFHVSIN